MAPYDLQQQQQQQQPPLRLFICSTATDYAIASLPASLWDGPARCASNSGRSSARCRRRPMPHYFCKHLNRMLPLLLLLLLHAKRVVATRPLHCSRPT